MDYYAGEYDVVVIGGGHAGCEAGLAAARLGLRTAIFAINLDSVANMPCNPSIGGTAKGHLVRELDALGGEMGKNTDKTFIQSKILNSAKGPAVFSLRAQADRRKYQMEMKHVIELQENLDLKQSEIVEIIAIRENEDDSTPSEGNTIDVSTPSNGNSIDASGRGEEIPNSDAKPTSQLAQNNQIKRKIIKGVKTHTGAIYDCKAVILTTGTFLKARIIMGDVSYSGGPDGLFPANKLSDSLSDLGINLYRFKTGTPARLNRRSVDFSKMEEQKGDEQIIPFSFENEEIEKEQVSCYLTYTTQETHNIIKANLHRSPLYSGDIKGIGPRYCPSIEDKVVRFADKDRHQVFLEPMGLGTEEMYLQGMSTSLPEEVQVKMMRSIPGLENVAVMRSAYAIEYDSIDATQLKLSLEFKDIDGLFSAGQVNGSSGYEEAAAQGLIAGINAAMKLTGREPLILDRSEAYIGVLIDDLVTKGTKEPYRIMTSRSEYRLLLRQDNADLRLTPKGYEVGLITEERYKQFLHKKETVEKEIERIEKMNVSPSETVNAFLLSKNSTPLKSGAKLVEILRRPEISYESLKEIDDKLPELPRSYREQVSIQIKYDGYIKRQFLQVQQFKKLEGKKLSPDIDYSSIYGLRIEARQKLSLLKPESIGQASRITGVSPADISVLLVYLHA